MTIVKGAIPTFSTLGDTVRNAADAISGLPLSGYLAGKSRGGYFVRALEDKWRETFETKYAIACNSATSGLLAAAFAVKLSHFDTFVCPAMTMSATAAAPMFTGAKPIFQDVSDEDFGLDVKPMPNSTRAIFTTNLFGHPSRLACNEWRTGDRDPVYLIEDNSQSPFAMTPNGRYAGTNGTIGVWSLNVHKHIQCGEGGIVTTDNDEMAQRINDFVNHGENVEGPIGLNLRMPEICAAVALSQLNRGKDIVEGRREQAEAIIAAIGDIPGLRPPVVRAGCTHAYYTIPFLIPRGDRTTFCSALRAEGVPIVEGYVEPLYRMKAFANTRGERPCRVAEDLQDHRLFYFENCTWSPFDDQIKQIGDAFRKAAEETAL